MPAKLFLLPLPISESESGSWIGPDYQDIVKGTTLFFVENIRTARRFISSLKLGIVIDQLRFEVLNKDSSPAEIGQFGQVVLENGKAIIMSESGCPAIADPGSKLVDEAHRLGIEVFPFVGPSSVLLALMGSGLSGQNFCFHGYLPIDESARAQEIRRLERESVQRNQTQIFIETPYRNSQIWKSLLKELQAETKLGFGRDLLGKNQLIRQMPVKKWRQIPDLEWDKFPTVFLFLA